VKVYISVKRVPGGGFTWFFSYYQRTRDDWLPDLKGKHFRNDRASINKVILPLEGDRLCCRISCERVPEKLF
jgi:hypothetical protein